MFKVQELIKLISENPDLPILPMVDCEVVSEDGGRWLGYFGSCYVGEYALFNCRYYDKREEFKEAYYNCYCDELSEEFEYDPRICFPVNDGKYTTEQIDVNKANEERLKKYLEEVADEYFTKAIIVNIDLPE